jgi:hypothetical protein
MKTKPCFSIPSRRMVPLASSGWFGALTLVTALLTFLTPSLKADSYDDMYIESFYITQCSCTPANSTVNMGSGQPAYGVLNDWRIGNGMADFVQPGEAAVGIIGLLYGENRLNSAGRNNSTLDNKAKTALSGFFWSWIRNGNNRQNNGFPASITYDNNGNVTGKGSADARVTAELLIAMRKYCLLSPNGDRGNYQSQMYSQAHNMADFINVNFGSWTIDRSYVVASFHCFAHWANAAPAAIMKAGRIKSPAGSPMPKTRVPGTTSTITWMVAGTAFITAAWIRPDFPPLNSMPPAISIMASCWAIGGIMARLITGFILPSKVEPMSAACISGFRPVARIISFIRGHRSNWRMRFGRLPAPPATTMISMARLGRIIILPRAVLAAG